MEITLARALKYKNRLIGKISDISGVIIRNNSILKDTEREIDIEEMLALRTKLVTNLVALKSAICKGNEPIQSDIFNLSELKSLSKMVQDINTTHGKSLRDGGLYSRVAAEPVEYEAQLRFSDIKVIISSTNREIDAVQEKIDQHNYSTKIDVEVLDNIY